MGALIHVTAWERASLWRRLACATGRVAALLVILYFLGELLIPPIGLFIFPRWMARKAPGVKVTPLPLTDYAISDAPGTSLCDSGYCFEVPWTSSFTIKGSKERSSKGGLVVFNFASGQGVLLIAPSDQTGLLNETLQDSSVDLRNLRLIYGDLVNRSPYDQYATILNRTPSTIRAFGPRKEAVRGMVLLMMKGIALPASLGTGAFTFQFPDKRGFQIGDPRKSKSVELEIFDLNGRYLEITCATNPKGSLSQPELNRILKTLHPEPSASAASAPSTRHSANH